jgi:limonene-1,2-epoxide hydrolase
VSDANAADRDIGGMFAAIDAFDTDSFLDYLSEEAVFRFGSAPPVQGRAAIGVAIDGFFGTIAGCSHKIAKTMCESETLVCEGEVTYRRQDGSEISLPFTDIFEYDGELIAHYKIYIDAGPLYAE